jgi:hypothetical protein
MLVSFSTDVPTVCERNNCLLLHTFLAICWLLLHTWSGVLLAVAAYVSVVLLAAAVYVSVVLLAAAVYVSGVLLAAVSVYVSGVLPAAVVYVSGVLLAATALRFLVFCMHLSIPVVTVLLFASLLLSVGVIPTNCWVPCCFCGLAD